MKWVFAVVLIGIAFGGCSSTENQPKTKRGTSSERISPLGVAYPDPERILLGLLASISARDFDATCQLLCGPRKSDGTPVPLIPGKNIAPVPSGQNDVWPPALELQGLSQFLKQPWVQIHYDRPRVIMNEPTFLAVPVRVRYAWEQVPEAERVLLTRALSEREGRNVSYGEVVAEGQRRELAQERGQEPLPELGFAHVGGGWRLYLGPLPPK